ncbi:MAG: disulfide bond formation protein B, partial [Enterobacteriaceae bacterium]
IAPGFLLVRYAAIVLWLYSAWEGVRLSWEHTMKILHPNPFATCDFIARFPGWLPLDKWLPAIFRAEADCSVSQWRWLSLEMPQWLLIIFSIFLLLGVIVAISQFVKLPRRDFFSFR